MIFQCLIRSFIKINSIFIKIDYSNFFSILGIADIRLYLVKVPIKALMAMS